MEAGNVTKFVIKQILLLGIVFYCLPIFWWTYNDMDSEHDNDYFLSAKFLTSTGSLMAAMGMSYVALPIGLVPGFIPIIGGIDGSIAKLTAVGGLMMAYMGYTAGHGNVSGEFQIVATVISNVYGVVVPIFRNKIAPLMVPVVKAVAVPMKAAANFILGVIVAKVQDPNSITTLVEMAGRREL